MSAFVRAFVAICLLSVFAATALLGVWSPADAKIWEGRFVAADRAPSGEVVFVDIDAESLAAVGTWPWPRSLHGQLLDRLMALGAYEVAFDVDFSARSIASEDDAFAQSLQKAGGYAYLAAFRQRTASGVEVWSRPLSEFASYAGEVLVNVDGLKAGLIWSLPGLDATTGLQSIAARFEPDEPVPKILRIDYAVDLNQIVHVPAVAVLDGTVDASLLQDRQVIIGTSAIELHDLLVVPRYGVVPGAVVQIAAAETIKLKRALTDFGAWPALVVGALFVLASALMPKVRLHQAIRVALVSSVALEAAAFAAYMLSAVQVDTASFHALVVSVLVVRLIDERIVRRRVLRAQHARLVYLANHDDHTGALSQNAWCDAVNKLIEGGQRVGTLLLRIEHIDNAGASLGFRLTDQVLIQFYDRLRSIAVGPIARVESHVFALWLHEAIDDASISDILQMLGEPYVVEDHRIALQLRWGRAVAEAGKSAAELLHGARTALAMAVRKDRVGCAYATDFEGEFERRRRLDIALRSAIEKNELDLAFQLQNDAVTRTVLGVEALLRWNSWEWGTISPAEFIPLAEENGTIIELGSWVAHEACRRAVQNGWSGRVSINVAPAQFAGSNVLDIVRSALDKSGFPAERLDIEITESLVTGGHLSMVQTLESLRNLGVSIAIDDFGTGHSSLSYLAGLPVDKLKIDQSFVRQIKTPRVAEVINAIVRLGKGLGLSIVIEGVETEEELTIITALSCDAVQGYLFGRPGPLPVEVQSQHVAA